MQYSAYHTGGTEVSSLKDEKMKQMKDRSKIYWLTIMYCLRQIFLKYFILIVEIFNFHSKIIK